MDRCSPHELWHCVLFMRIIFGSLVPALVPTARTSWQGSKNIHVTSISTFLRHQRSQSFWESESHPSVPNANQQVSLQQLGVPSPSVNCVNVCECVWIFVSVWVFLLFLCILVNLCEAVFMSLNSGELWIPVDCLKQIWNQLTPAGRWLGPQAHDCLLFGPGPGPWALRPSSSRRTVPVMASHGKPWPDGLVCKFWLAEMPCFHLFCTFLLGLSGTFVSVFSVFDSRLEKQLAECFTCRSGQLGSNEVLSYNHI